MSVSSDTFWELRRQGSKTLLIAFSHVDMAPGRFAQHNVFSKVPADVLFLNCPGNDYYLDGIPGLGSDRQSTLRTLDNICRRNGYDSVTCFGNSMGGFAAVLYGLELGTNILALAPEYLLGIRGGASRLKMTNRGLQGMGRHAIKRACELYSNPGTHIRIVFGELDFSDLVCAAAMSRILGERVVTVADAPHSIAPFLEANVGLLSVLRSALIDLDDTTIAPWQGSLLCYRHVIRLGFDTYVKQLARPVRDDVLQLAASFQPAAHVAVQAKRLAGSGLDLLGLCDPASLNILVHLAGFDMDRTRWREMASPATLRSVVRRYRQNASWGELHRFLGYVLGGGLLGVDELVSAGIPATIAGRVAERI